MSLVRNATILLVAIASAMGASWALPANSGPDWSMTSKSQVRAVEMRSASGKITSVSRSSFTLRTMQTDQKNPGARFLLGQQPGAVMTFVIDQNTAIDGKLEVGKTANVAYRQDANGDNVAVSVRVTPES
ncbi:MAG: hypothetical protein ACRD4S_13800 [Candidatus Acidiferrales bacterium]